MDVILLALVKQDRELALADEARQAVGGGHIAGRQGRQRRGVELRDLARRGDLLPVLVDQERGSGVGVLAQAAQSFLQLQELFAEHDEVVRTHGKSHKV